MWRDIEIHQNPSQWWKNRSGAGQHVHLTWVPWMNLYVGMPGGFIHLYLEFGCYGNQQTDRHLSCLSLFKCGRLKRLPDRTQNAIPAGWCQPRDIRSPPLLLRRVSGLPGPSWRAVFSMGGWIKGTPVFQLSLWLPAIWFYTDLKRANTREKKPLSSRTESLHLILVLFPSFLEHWLSHIDGALTFALSEPPLHTIMSPLRPLVLIYVFDAGSLDFNSIRETLELNGFPAWPNVHKQLKRDQQTSKEI